MIAPQDRFWVASDLITGERHSFNIIDWDQRRYYVINGSTKLLPDKENVDVEAIDILKRHMDRLAWNVYSITINDDRSLGSASTNPEDGPTLTIDYPLYSAAQSLHDCSVITLSKLTELDRLGPCVDLVRYVDELGVQRKSVFKYTIIFQRRMLNWNELHIIKNIPDHPGIVPFDHVVVDDLESVVLGFTTQFIPGGTFDENTNRTFRFEG